MENMKDFDKALQMLLNAGDSTPTTTETTQITTIPVETNNRTNWDELQKLALDNGLTFKRTNFPDKLRLYHWDNSDKHNKVAYSELIDMNARSSFVESLVKSLSNNNLHSKQRTEDTLHIESVESESLLKNKNSHQILQNRVTKKYERYEDTKKRMFHKGVTIQFVQFNKMLLLGEFLWVVESQLNDWVSVIIKGTNGVIYERNIEDVVLI